MKPFNIAIIVSLALFAIFKENSLLLYFFGFIGIYTSIYIIYPAPSRFNSARRKLMFATWDKARDGNIYIKLELNCTKVLKHLEKIDKSNRPTITHFATKAMGEMLKAGKN